VIVNLLNACPNRCKGCFSYNGKDKLSLNQFRTIIDKLPKDIKAVVLSGGEPCLHPDLLKICKYTADNLIKPTLFTSGCVPIDIKPFKKHIYDLTITVKFPDLVMDSEWKKNKSCPRNIRNLLEQANELRMKVNINYAVDRENFIYMKEMVDFAKKYNAEVRLLRYLPYDENTVELALTDDEWETVCEQAVKYNIMIQSPSKHYSYKICTAGVGRMVITPKADVSPCLYWTFDTYGNLLKEDYSTIERRLEEWRYVLGEDYIGCPVERYLRMGR